MAGFFVVFSKLKILGNKKPVIIKRVYRCVLQCVMTTIIHSTSVLASLFFLSILIFICDNNIMDNDDCHDGDNAHHGYVTTNIFLLLFLYHRYGHLLTKLKHQ